MGVSFNFMNDQLILYFPSLKNSANIGHDRFGMNRSDRKKIMKAELRGDVRVSMRVERESGGSSVEPALKTSRLKSKMSCIVSSRAWRDKARQ